MKDRWEDAAAYDRFMGRWSRLLADQFVAWLSIPRDATWLEIGCGTGSLTSAICEHAHPREVRACDTAPDFVDYVRDHVRDPVLQVVVASTDSLPAREHGYDVVASSLVLNFLPTATSALMNMRQASAIGGVVTACVWDYAEGMQFLRRFWDAAVSLNPAARALDEGVRFPLCRPGPLQAAFLRAGLEDVEVAPLQIPTPFDSFDDYWAPFVDGPGPAPTYVASLSATQRQELAGRLRSDFDDSSTWLQMTARAWAVRGRRTSA